MLRPPGKKPKESKAVALSYDHERDDLPRVTASGRGELARKIVEIAFANGVKVREDADLAELLSVIDVDCPIPYEAFTTVAEILAYLYRANGMFPKESSAP